MSSRDQDTVIVQPANKETGPGILLPLMYLYKRCPEAIVSVFPSDHFILEEDRFMAHVDLAAQAVARNPSRIVLLAMEAHAPEVEYGYVVRGHTVVRSTYTALVGSQGLSRSLASIWLKTFFIPELYGTQ